ncbi:MAG: amidohydrolase family protein, partial [bacterium]
YPDHYTEEFVKFSWEAKKAKMRLTADVHCDVNNVSWKHNFDCRPEQLLEATKACDKIIVFAIQAPFTGINGSQEAVAEFARQHSDRFIPWCSVDPNNPGCVEQLEYYVTRMGFQGLKLGPIYQNFDPSDPKHLPLFKKAEKLGIPINWHQGTSFVRQGPLKYSNPILLEDIAVACPDLKMIISHMGHPWETDCIVLIRKHPNLYADTSALHYRPWRHYQAFITALEYGVEHKLIFGSDFPSATPEQAIAGLWKVNDVIEGTKFPVFPREAIHRIIYDNWQQLLKF